jgi:nucleoside-diphosphate kinase
MANEERHCFITEWYDTHAEIRRRYQLMRYPDNTITMYDIKNRRKFLSRTAMSDIPEKLFIGTKLNIHSRQHTIVAYGDDKTETDHSGLNEAILFVFPESKWSAVGNVLNNVYRNGLKITNVKSLHLNKDCSEVVGFEGRALAMAVQGNDSFALMSSCTNPSDVGYVSTEKDAVRSHLEAFFNDISMQSTSLRNEKCTCAVIKPSFLHRSGEIINAIEKAGFQITAMRLNSLDRKEVEEFYEVYRDVVTEYTGMVDELSSGPSLALEISTIPDGEHTRFREFCGPVDPKVASAIRPGTLRAIFGINRIKNAIHCTDLDTDGAFESNYMFNVL